LAFLSYRYVERNTKSVRLSFRHAFFGMFLMPALLIIALTYGAQAARPVVNPSVELSSYGRNVCHCNFDKHCIRGDSTKKPTILMIGDSHAAMLNSFIDVVGLHEGWAANVVTASSCSPVFGFDETVLPQWAHKPCRALKAFVVENYKRYDAVFLAS